MRALPRGSLVLLCVPAEVGWPVTFMRRGGYGNRPRGSRAICHAFVAEFSAFFAADAGATSIADVVFLCCQLDIHDAIGRHEAREANRLSVSENFCCRLRCRRPVGAHTSLATAGKRSCKACTVISSCRRASIARTAARPLESW